MLPIPVFRVEKNANYTTMSNYHLRDSTISFKAKGILSMFLSLPKDWSYSVSGLAAISKEGKDGILSGLKAEGSCCSQSSVQFPSFPSFLFVPLKRSSIVICSCSWLGTAYCSMPGATTLLTCECHSVLGAM